MSLEKNSKKLHEALIKLVRAYQLRDRNKLFDCCQGLTVNQYYVIATIVQYGEMGVVELSNKLYQDKGNISRIVDSLVNDQYLRKIRHPKDGRAFVLSLTEHGLETYKKIESIEIEDMKRLLQNLEIEKPEGTIKLISRFADEAENSFK